ncbi:MAG: polymer-forming cytoskeletal protein [Xanthomonadales bacterium]|nr:polymer-forming cytoskeletal protein [Xanthomonadales bacterium]
MFNNKKAGAEAAAETTIIAKGVSLRGDVSFCGNLYLEGSIEGSLRAADEGHHAVFTLSNQGRVVGEIRVAHVVIDGTVEGDIFCTERLELAANAMIHGDVHYKVLEMAAGARVTGRMIHEDETVARQLTGPSAVADAQAAAADDDDMMAANARA